MTTAITGIGMTAVGEHWGTALRELAAAAAHQALNDAGLKRVDAIYVANAYGSTFNQQSHLAALIADYMGLRGVEAITIESGDAAGGAALRMAHLAVSSGQVEHALVIGAEKVTDIVGSDRVKARNISLDADYEAMHGATLTALAALLMRRYMHEYGVDLNAFEGFSINAHANGQKNDYAMYRNSIKAGAFARAPMTAEPVSLFDSAPDGDGAAAVVIVPATRAEDEHPVPIRITGSAAATDSFMLQDRPRLLHLAAVEHSVNQALARARLTREAIDLFEVHDAFTILSVLSLEAAGFAMPGQGWQMSSEIGLHGKLPISTFGGLKSRGHPAGATGVYQAVEACQQLRGSAGANQVPGAKTAMIQSLGGLAASAVTHILQRR
ncbi:MAG: thiolase domain-containing protein [Anaerolineae bacterium]|jgi:acetyl-CoA C-acetyltransferase|nr:thiolase domain-containing protein [Anaerolineae bacterium]